MNNTVLIIEDRLEVSENIAAILKLRKYQVLTAPNGKVGVFLAVSKKPDLIICDIIMPELDGYEVLQVLHHHPNTSDIPFIFLTAKSELTDFCKGMELGADEYLVKPFEGIDLLEMVEKRLTKRSQLPTNRIMESDFLAYSSFWKNGSIGFEKLPDKKVLSLLSKGDFTANSVKYKLAPID